MSVHHESNLELEGALSARIIKHGRIKRLMNKARRNRQLDRQPFFVDIKKVMSNR